MSNYQNKFTAWGNVFKDDDGKLSGTVDITLSEFKKIMDCWDDPAVEKGSHYKTGEQTLPVRIFLKSKNERSRNGSEIFMCCLSDVQPKQQKF